MTYEQLCFFVLIFRIKIVVVGAVGKWSTRSETESCPLIHQSS